MPMEFEAGNYVAEILDHSITKATTGNLQLVVSIRPIGKVNADTPDGDLDECPQGKTRTMYLTITEKTKERRMAELRAIGFEGKSPVVLDRTVSGSAFVSLAGKHAPVTCAANVWAGKENERWEFNIPGVGAVQATPIDNEAARYLAMMFGDTPTTEPTKPANANANANKNKPKAATGAPAKGAGFSDDSEIPF